MFIDSREPSELYSLIKKKGISVEKYQLEVGDVTFSNVGIERKEMNDFAHSLIDGRLWRQLISLKETYPRRLLIVEGSLSSRWNNPKAMEAKITGAKYAVLLSLQIPIVYTKDIKDTANVLERLFFKAMPSTSDRPLPPKKHLKTDRERRENIIGSIDGVGLNKARKILYSDKSIHDVCHMESSDLRKIKGIGPSLAKNILRVLNEKSDDEDERSIS